MYSLVNSPTLVRDLARHPRADAVADVLLRAFALDRDALTDLDRTAYDGIGVVTRARLLAEDGDRPRALQVLAAARSAASDDGLDGYTAAVEVLERTPIGDLADLVRFVRHEVLAHAWDRSDDVAVSVAPTALDLVTDALVGAYCGDDVLASRWSAVGTSPAATAWPAIVDAVATLPSHVAWPVVPAEWARSMHEACWAVHLTRRDREVAVTQLHALRALVARTGPQPPLRAVSTVVAAVHAHCVGDVLDTTTHLTMTTPLFRLLP